MAEYRKTREAIARPIPSNTGDPAERNRAAFLQYVLGTTRRKGIPYVDVVSGEPLFTCTTSSILVVAGRVFTKPVWSMNT